MTIRIYPSRLPGEPLETHCHAAMTLHEWMTANVSGYSINREQPVTVEINGRRHFPEKWNIDILRPSDDVRIYPVPRGAVALAWVAVAMAVASAAYAIFSARGMDSSYQSVVLALHWI